MSSSPFRSMNLLLHFLSQYLLSLRTVPKFVAPSPGRPLDFSVSFVGRLARFPFHR